MIISKNLKKFNNVRHGFFNRAGGVSSGIYKSLNCGIGSKDKKKNVRKNLKIVSKKIGCSQKKLILLNQTHSSKFNIIKQNHKFDKKRIKADALITNVKNVAISVLSADCAPILFYDSKKKIIGAVHAGWRGAYKKILSKIIKHLLKKGSSVNNLHFVVGPSIAQKNYEVGAEFNKKFLDQNIKNKKYFKNVKKRFFFSLNDYIKGQLQDLRIKNIEIIKNILSIAKKNKVKFSNKLKIKYVKDRPGHDKRYAVNSNKIRKELNWKPKISLSVGLNKTLRWYVTNKKFFEQISKKNINKRFGLKI